jgi:hypothetical protein
MKKIVSGLACALLWTHAASAQTLTIPDRIEKLADKARDSQNITLDGSLLKLAAAFLNSNDRDQKIAKDVISNLKGIHVRNFEFEKEGEFSDRDLDPIRDQLKPPAWARIIESREHGEHQQIFVRTEKDKIAGLVILSAERKELSIVIIDGAIDLKQLSSLGGNFGIPKDLPAGRTPGSARDSE